jgi:hypothetical protein
MKIRKLIEMTAKEWSILVISLLLLPSIALALRLKGFKWTRSVLHKRIPKPVPDTRSLDQRLEIALSVSRMVATAANYGPYRASCLKRSLTSWWLLQRMGIAAKLIIGVNKHDGNLNAHAWVEYHGNKLLEADNITARFSAFELK